ncbi:MAG: C cytochrome precursor, partial [Planctomycetes bacterium]|nr:C cytochrome precursor [Planctomycetota bacterium]
MRGNQACVDCHRLVVKDPQPHTHHSAGSSGSLCYNCHMPHTSFALFTAMRSHRIVVPNVAKSVRSGRPNACNLCHLDKTFAWTSRHLQDWYGTAEVELNEENQTIPASLLWLLRGDASQRLIAAWHMGWKPAREAAGTGWQAPFLSRTLEDPYSVVRYVAWRALQKQPGFQRFEFDFIGAEQDRSDQAIA